LVVAGWILAALTVPFPPLALGAVAIGGVLIGRGRVGTGVAIIVTSVLAVVVFVYLASQTLVPRD
jgi:hypothetical protein